ncbi:hypothetical protein [Phocaeicola coprocola]|nr:hypothetical protein [Bacteroidaceae bacterium]
MVFLPLPAKFNNKGTTNMKAIILVNTVRYINKIHDFHAWGAAALI